MAKAYLISVKTLKTWSVLNNNVDEMYIIPAIDYAQDAGLQPIIGTQLYDKLVDLVYTGYISTVSDYNEYKVLLEEYITPYLLNKVTADIQLPLHFKFRNQGVVQQTSENTYNPSLHDLQFLIQDYENKAAFYANRLSDYLCANRDKFPEYGKRSSAAEMPANPGAYKTNIYLG